MGALSKKEKIQDVRGALDKLKPQLAMALPRHIKPDRLVRVAMSACQTNPKLLECDRNSFFAAIMTCAQLGLEPDGVLGQAYLVPFKNRVQFIPGYKGYLLLARNSGEISTIQAHAVYRGDEFRYSYGLNEDLFHVPGEGERTDEDITHFYAYAIFKDGGKQFEVMTRSDVERVRDGSDGYKAFKAGKIRSNPWADHFAQMGRKTLIRRLANYLPMSVQRAAAIDSAIDAGTPVNLNEIGDFDFAPPEDDAIEGSASAAQLEDGTKSRTESKLDDVATTGEEDPDFDEVEENPEPKKAAAKKSSAKKVAAKKAEPAPEPANEEDDGVELFGAA